MILHVYIGWDEREAEAYRVCEFSMLRHATCNLRVHPLKHRRLRKQQLFWRPWRIDAEGQYWDEQDGKPFSTEFSHTRFLVPHLAKRDGAENWAIFVDADFLFRADIVEMLRLCDETAAISCVKHEFWPTENLKMDGMIQSHYARKNWSSLMAFNLEHPALSRLTPECVNTADGSWLHRFEWLDEREIHGLPLEWNYLVGHSASSNPVKAYHFTNGGPWLDGWEPHAGDDLWEQEAALIYHPTPTIRDKMIEAAE